MAFKLGCSQATDSPCKAAALCRSCCWPPRQGRRPWPSPWVGHRWVLPWPTVFFPCWHLPDSWAQQCFLSQLRFLVPAQLLDLVPALFPAPAPALNIDPLAVCRAPALLPTSSHDHSSCLPSFLFPHPNRDPLVPQSFPGKTDANCCL